MLIGVVSDTHGKIESTRQAIRMLESLEVDLVIHCGDIGSPVIVPLFRLWPTHFVFGNVDCGEQIRDTIDAEGQNCHERFGSLELVGKRIAFMHGDDGDRFEKIVESGQWDLVCYGHTHTADISTRGRTTLLNPGALSNAGRYSIAAIELPSLKATSIAL